MIAAIRATGEAFFGGTIWRGKRCMRVSVCNWADDRCRYRARNWCGPTRA